MSNHFYHPTTGELVGGLREARLVSALPSPTTVLGLIKGEGLIQYFKKSMFEAAVTTPRRPEWTDAEFYDACVKWSEEHSLAARDKGLALHKIIQEFHQAVVGMRPFPEVVEYLHGSGVAAMATRELRDGFDLYLRWYEKWVRKTLAVEQFVVGQGYAGREDHCCVLQDGRVSLVDVKTQDISKRNKFNFYFSWALQLGAYAGACPPYLGEQSRHIDCIISIAVASTGPAALEAKVWDRPVSYYHDLFLGLLAVWQEENQYWPTGPVEATP